MYKQILEGKVMVNEQHDETGVVTAICPSCKNRSTFKHLGTQVWPDAIAERLDIPHKTELYLCDTCYSTISDRNLEKD